MRFLLDEHIPGAVVRGLQRRHPEVDVLRVVDAAGMMGAPDEAVLAFAASEGRIVVTRDQATLTDFAYARVERGETMPGVIAVTRQLSVGVLLSELELVIVGGTPEDFADKVYYLP